VHRERIPGERRPLDARSLFLGVLAFLLIAGYLLARRHWAPGATRRDPVRPPVTTPEEEVPDPASTPAPGPDAPSEKRNPRGSRAR